MASLTIDFFHDVVCCWCFNTSSRMRDFAVEFDLYIQHHTFVLQASSAEMASRWGTPEQARKTILGHGDVCRQVSDQPELIDIDAMRAAPFDYPHGLTAAIGCKAVERLGGQAAHWDMFDRFQSAHLTHARDIADPEVVLNAAGALGLTRRISQRSSMPLRQFRRSRATVNAPGCSRFSPFRHSSSRKPVHAWSMGHEMTWPRKSVPQSGSWPERRPT